MKLSGNSLDKKICSLFIEKISFSRRCKKSWIQNIIPRLDKSLLIPKVFNPAVVKIYLSDNAFTRMFDPKMI